ncbi:forkhead box protein O [Frankliniella occidentalis]|uniref:Forkhead box protein O n=1 Tax=Frankliniella occidentalis TaxID=133901 RepID=A0A9C6X0D3_FRAOC|nr:forkhead box protein O [Frankliniella occidentalis]
MEDVHGDLLDCGFELEPQTRARSNTWPLPRPENFVDMMKEEGDEAQCAGMTPNMCLGLGGLGDLQVGQVPGAPPLPGLGAHPAAAAAAAAAAKKNSTRRNAWGNLSYADLITQAITTAPDKRLTLSQIYEWMVHNVPYFKDKGDSNSSAGWKNSIRHNLSLHNRFMRVQNEGTGKSSWWMINPDAKPGKSARRRATSMETSKFEKRRGRVKKKVDAMRNCLGATDASPSPCSSVSEGLDMFPDSPLHSSFQLSPDFRPRASSNASSCGRLSPIPSVEPDWGPSPSYYAADALAGSLEATMKLHPADLYPGFSGSGSQQSQQQSEPAGPPPPYQPAFDVSYPSPGSAGSGAGGGAPSGSLSFSTGACPVHRLQGCSCMLHCAPESVSPGGPGMSPTYQRSEPSPDSSFQPQRPPQPQQPPPPYQPQPPSPDALGDLGDGLPGGADSAGCRSPRAGQGQPQGQLPPIGSLTDAMSAPTTMMGQLMAGALNPSLLDDLNLNIEGGFECNVDEVIQNELSFDGNLDFNFTQHMPLQQAVTSVPQAGAQHGASTQSPYTSVTSGHSWVH